MDPVVSRKMPRALVAALVLVGTLLSGSALVAVNSENDENRVMICYRSEETVVDVMDLMESYNGKFIKEIEQGRILVYTIPAEAYNMIQKDVGWYSDIIEYIELDRAVHASFTPNDTYWGSQWNMTMIDGARSRCLDREAG